jgi:ATP-dependent DNA ligase
VTRNRLSFFYGPVALDEQGRPSFEALQGAFDLLKLEGKDLTKDPLTARRALLESLLKQSVPRLHYDLTIKACLQSKCRSASQSSGNFWGKSLWLRERS